MILPLNHVRSAGRNVTDKGSILVCHPAIPGFINPARRELHAFKDGEVLSTAFSVDMKRDMLGIRPSIGDDIGDLLCV